MSFEKDYYYDRNMFFKELSQSIETRKLSTNVLFSNYLNEFKDIVQHNGLVQEEMNIVCQLLCTVELHINSFKQVLLTLVPEEPIIPSNICEELIIFALSTYRLSEKDELKAQCLLYWILYVVEEKLTNMEIIDKYYKVLFFLCDYEKLSQPVAGIIYNLTKPNDVQKWMISSCKNNLSFFKNLSSIQKLLKFFENSNDIYESRQKGYFDNTTKFCKELACGLRSVRKELMSIHQSTQSQQLIEYNRKSSTKFYSKIQFVNVNKKFELPSAKDLAKSFMKPIVCNNSLSLLGNTSGWFKLLINTNEELNLQHRFLYNLYQSLDQIFLSKEIIMTLPKKTKFLQEILEFQKFTHRGLVVMNKFMFEYLLSWDGMELARTIYDLIEYLSFTSEEELKNKFLDKLFGIFIFGDELIYRMVINSLTNLLCNLHLNSRRTVERNCILFGEKLRKETEFDIVRCLTKYISHWCSICIYHYPQEEQLKNTIYTFFEKVSILENTKPYIWPLWTIMPPNVFYNGMMSINIYWLDRMAKLMLRHINDDIDRVDEIVNPPWILKSIKMFELYMADLYNALQLGTLFEKREEGFIFQHLHEEEIVKDLNMVNLNSCFQMKKHIALAPYYMNAKNTVKDPMDLISTYAPNLHILLLKLNEKLQNDTQNESLEC